jgi:hypothetical protein
VIYQIAHSTEAALQSKKFPIRVLYGPERLERCPGESVIVIERDRDSSDSFAAPQGQQTNPRRMATRQVAAKATIWAKSNAAGAMIGDHEGYCEALVDALFCALQIVIRPTQHGAMSITDARYVNAAGLASVVKHAETWPGVVYVMRWRAPRGVYHVDYTGAGLPTGAATATSNRVEIALNNDDPPEVVPFGEP